MKNSSSQWRSAAEVIALVNKVKNIRNPSIDLPKTAVVEVSHKVPLNADSVETYIAPLKGNPVLSQVSGWKANSDLNGSISGNTTARSEGSSSCFRCGKLGHWSKDCDAPDGGGSFSSSGNDTSVAEKACPCGSGVCLVLTAKTDRNRGRKFYRCPVRQENGGCGFFEWCDSAPVTKPTTYGSPNPSSSSFSDLQCPCGAGSCKILTAKTGENVGKQFYRCPSFQASCGFFQWCEEPSMKTKNQASAPKVYSNTNNTSKSVTASVKTGSSSSCYKYGGEGHWAKDCSQSLSSSNPPAEYGRSQSSSLGSCFKCGKPGHWAKDCSNSEY